MNTQWPRFFCTTRDSTGSMGFRCHNLKELRPRTAPNNCRTQVELAERLQRAQASISAMETADDNPLSTWRAVVESMGGHLELVAVFDDERIAIPT